ACLCLRMGGFQPYLAPTEADCFFENPAQYFDKAKEQCEVIINDGWQRVVGYSADPDSYRNQFLNYLLNCHDTSASLLEIRFGNLVDMVLSVHGRIRNINGVDVGGTSGIPRGFANVNATVTLYNAYAEEDVRRTWSIAGYRNKYASSNQRFTMSYFFD